ncbi:MAG: tetratricopeptide repeat protein [Gemmataceae bacterium]|nr:tetratricopeptide repeat protein [Gemmataceae bacterium]
MRLPLIVDFYHLLPEQTPDADPRRWAQAFRKALARFKKSVAARYGQSTLERLLHAPVAEVRQAAVLALGLIGTIRVNEALAARLHDEDPVVAEMAADALWSLWFRADLTSNNEELQRLMQMELTDADSAVILAGFDALVRRAPRFAEAYNQRAIVYFRMGELAKSIADCERVLRLNPCHFGAASGMAQCFVKLKKLRAALRSYRRANRINPRLDGVRDAIASLEKILGEEGRR